MEPCEECERDYPRHNVDCYHYSCDNTDAVIHGCKTVDNESEDLDLEL